MSPRRRTVAEHGIETARVRPGYEASVLDVSISGILIETMHRLLPGTTIELQLWLADRRTSIRGHVLRSTVASLRRGPVLYRGAVAFDRPLAPFPHNSQQSTVNSQQSTLNSRQSTDYGRLPTADGYAVPPSNATEKRHGREDATPPTL
jgi:PilZ domain